MYLNDCYVSEFYKDESKPVLSSCGGVAGGRLGMMEGGLEMERVRGFKRCSRKRVGREQVGMLIETKVFIGVHCSWLNQTDLFHRQCWGANVCVLCASFTIPYTTLHFHFSTHALVT